jgi:uroporphyrinogen-III synthase
VADHSPSFLAGKRVVITRAESQSAVSAEALRARGAEIISLPLIRIAPPRDSTHLDSALRQLASFDWLVFTSQNAVQAVSYRLAELGISPPETLTSPRVAAVGSATADAAVRAGFSVAYAGEGGTAADLVNELANDLRGQGVLLPRSDRAASSVVKQLRNLGATVVDVMAYRTLSITEVDSTKREIVARADAILFFSPSAVEAFLSLIKSGALNSLRDNVAVGAIGPVTDSALREAGLRCDFQAPEPSVNEIVTALAAHFEKAKVSSASGVNLR